MLTPVDFLRYLECERNYSKITINDYKESLDLFERYFKQQTGQDTILWQEINTGDIREWIMKLVETKRSSATVNSRLSALRSFYRFLLQRGEVKGNPTSKIIGPKSEKKLPEFVREKEMDHLLDILEAEENTWQDKRNRLMILMFYSTGMRLSELRNLKIKDVDFNTQTIKVTGKRNKQRLIPFGKELYDVMKDYFQSFDDKEQNIFINEKHALLSEQEIRGIVKSSLSLVTSIKKKSPHVLRHSFASAMLNNGASIEVVKELLGHESIETTQIYTHINFESIKKAYNGAHPRQGKE